VLGVVSGFFFGLFLALTLLLLAVIRLDSILLVVLPVLFAVAVPLVAWFAPIGGGPGAPAAPAAPAPTAPPAPGDTA
jgi:hypothetical protein